MNRAAELRKRRSLIIEQHPCLGSRDPQEVLNCRHSEYGADDAWLELSDIEMALAAVEWDAA